MQTIDIHQAVEKYVHVMKEMFEKRKQSHKNQQLSDVLFESSNRCSLLVVATNCLFQQLDPSTHLSDFLFYLVQKPTVQIEPRERC